MEVQNSVADKAATDAQEEQAPEDKQNTETTVEDQAVEEEPSKPLPKAKLPVAKMPAKKVATKVDSGFSKNDIKHMTVEQMENLKAELEEKKFNKMTKEEKALHSEEVRNEGLLEATKPKEDATSEVIMEIEDPGAASKVAEEGAKTINSTEFAALSKTLQIARSKADNKLGEGGFNVEL